MNKPNFNFLTLNSLKNLGSLYRTNSLKAVDNLYAVSQRQHEPVKMNWKLHNPDSPLLTGIKETSVVRKVNEPS